MLKKIKQIGIIPVARIENPAHSIPLVDALSKGGIPCIEVTFRSSTTEEAIRRISQERHEVLVGAGTILTIEQAKAALRAGAKFLVTPGFNPKIVDFAQTEEIPIFPGVNSPTNIEAALEKGLEVLKFFPAEQSGGRKMLKAFSGPYQKVKFIPTGGININNLNDYLSLPNVIACGGSWLVNSKLVNSENFEEIEKLTSEALANMLDFSLSHIGINTENEEDALKNANKIFELFEFPTKVGNSSIFNGKEFEWMKKPFLGKNGHIAIGTRNVEAAMAFLKRRGIAFREETYKEKNDELVAVYLDIELGGFAFHLVKKC